MLAWLRGEFGAPVVDARKFEVVIDAKFDGQSHLSIATGRRVLNFGAVDLLPSRRSIVTHELYHFLYQSDQFLKRPRSEVEAWAAYAQLRYENLGASNRVITRDALSGVDDTNLPCAVFDDFIKQLNANEGDQKLLYNFVSAYLFKLNHEDAMQLLQNDRRRKSRGMYAYGAAVCGAVEKLREQGFDLERVPRPILFEDDVEALKMFQESSGITVDGQLGPETISVLYGEHPHMNKEPNDLSDELPVKANESEQGAGGDVQDKNNKQISVQNQPPENPLRSPRATCKQEYQDYEYGLTSTLSLQCDCLRQQQELVGGRINKLSGQCALLTEP